MPSDVSLHCAHGCGAKQLHGEITRWLGARPTIVGGCAARAFARWNALSWRRLRRSHVVRIADHVGAARHACPSRRHDRRQGRRHGGRARRAFDGRVLIGVATLCSRIFHGCGHRSRSAEYDCWFSRCWFSRCGRWLPGHRNCGWCRGRRRQPCWGRGNNGSDDCRTDRRACGRCNRWELNRRRPGRHLVDRLSSDGSGAECEFKWRHSRGDVG